MCSVLSPQRSRPERRPLLTSPTLGEEAIETALASVMRDKPHIAAESADLLYHLLVLLEATDVSLADVMAELERRRGIGGLVEKAARREG